MLRKRKPLSAITHNRMAHRASKDKDVSKTIANCKNSEENHSLQLHTKLQQDISDLYEQAQSLMDCQEDLPVVDIWPSNCRAGAEIQLVEMTPGDKMRKVMHWVGAAQRTIKEQHMRIRTLEREWR